MAELKPVPGGRETPQGELRPEVVEDEVPRSPVTEEPGGGGSSSAEAKLSPREEEELDPRIQADLCVGDLEVVRKTTWKRRLASQSWVAVSQGLAGKGFLRKLLGQGDFATSVSSSGSVGLAFTGRSSPWHSSSDVYLLLSKLSRTKSVVSFPHRCFSSIKCKGAERIFQQEMLKELVTSFPDSLKAPVSQVQPQGDRLPFTLTDIALLGPVRVILSVDGDVPVRKTL
ncbi:hypothetical protein P7K49_035234 [Saguinus oedipus]|uniref:Uncharacterized protein n=1 Tax=Saguinus oedipus TaxID=9490 RepID=A0ABQ9TM79_SAGOE|nr:hypothetical protein P7K49_035234 [Saguinus oedipus]